MDEKRLQRERVRTALRALSDRLGSQKKAGVAAGISSTTASDIIRGKDEHISEAMWQKLDAYFRHGESTETAAAAGWAEAETRPSKEMTFAIDDCRANAYCTWIVAPAGTGKSTTARRYASGVEGAVYVLCSEDMRRGDFLEACLRAAGEKSEGQTLREKLSRLIGVLRKMRRPVLILDEADKLADSLLLYCVTLYNKLEGHCGIVMLSTDYIKKRMRSGLVCNKRGFNELHSRIGRKFFETEKTSPADIAAVCLANGLTDERAIDGVIKDAEGYDYDLRRVRKSVLKHLGVRN